VRIIEIREVFYVAKKKTVVPFRGTAEQEAKLRELIAAHKDMRGALMPVLQQAQDIYGYLPIEVQKIIAEGLGVPLEQVYGVVTFYAQFSLNPKGKYSIAVCMGTACYVKGAAAVLERIEQKLGVEPGGVTPDGKFSLEETRCLGCCALAPVMTVNGEVYGRLVPDDVDRILDNLKDDND
jgi:NADP-reducing hydrogenase subunit HndA